MSATELDHLIKMLNQIADNIAFGESNEIAATKVADHVKRFWAPRMKEKIIQYAHEGGDRLLPTAKTAVSILTH